MRKAALWFVSVFIGLVAVVGSIGMLLPRDHIASIQLQIDQPAEQVVATISDFAGAREWRSDLQQVEILSSPEEPLRWRETTDFGTMTMALEVSESPTHMVTRIDDPDQPFGGRWIYDLAPARDVTILTITERGEVYNPFFRFMSRFVFGHYRTLETYARDLSRHLGSPGEPVRVRAGS